MKKITGKATALVLALALVVTSFSSTFAFAATKTASGTVSDTHYDDIYLVNGGSKEVDLTTWLIDSTDFRLETKEHEDVSGVKIDAISHVSGSSLVSLKTNSDDTATLKLKSNSASGTEVISVLFEGTWSDDDGNEYTVKAKQTLNVHVYDEGQIVFGNTQSSTLAAGEGLDDVSTFANTAKYTQTLGVYRAERDSDTSPLAVYAPVYLTTSDKAITLPDGVKDSNAYSIDVTSGDGDLQLNATATVSEFNAAAGTQLTATIGKHTGATVTGDAGATNVTITVKKLKTDTASTYKASSDSDDKYTLKTKIEKKVDVNTLLGYDFNSTKDSGNFTIKKTSGKSVLVGTYGLKSSAQDTKEYDVTNSEVVFDNTTVNVSIDDDVNVKKVSGTVDKLDIADATVGSVDLDHGEVYLADGKVGDISTNDLVTINSGKAGNIDNKDGSTPEVKVFGGTVGDIATRGNVTIQASDEDTPIVVGNVTAEQDVMVFSDDAKVTVASITASADHGSYGNGTFTLKGDQTQVGKIDFNYYDTKLALGDDDDAFVGTVSSLVNSKNADVETNEEDTVATIAGSVNVDTITVNSDTNLSFTGDVTVDTIDGDGTLTILPTKLFVTSSASGVTLKLGGSAPLANGSEVFKANKDAVDTEDMTPYGFTLSKSSGNSVDTFKIDKLVFAGVAIDKASATIAKGQSESFTASAYPAGTSLPAGTTIKWDLDGGSDSVFTLTTNGNTATVTVNSLDSTFTSENKTTLTATLYDADGYEMDDYAPAKTAITAVAVPVATSDTNNDFSVAQGSKYTFKITSSTAPSFTLGTAGVFTSALTSQSGNDYFYTITATGAVGKATGVYLNGTKLLVATVKAPVATFTSDTTSALKVAAGKSYTYKITAATAPSFGFGTAGVFTVSGITKTGNDYFYKVTAVGKAGTATGVFVNGVKVNVATVG